MSAIVFIEQDPELQKMLLKPLSEAGFEVTVCEDGEAGFQKIKELKPELVLVDAQAPEKNGEQILENIRTDFDLAFIPVIVITDGATVEKQKYLELGACDTIQKNEISPEVVVNKAQKCFSLGGGTLNTDENMMEKMNTSEISTQDKNTAVGIKVLIIEDDQFLSELCQTKLSKEGYNTITALDGETGLEKITTEKPDVVLLDILLPGIDGFEVLRQIKSNSDTEINNIPVLLLSNYGQESNIQKGMSLGAIDYLVKANFTTNEIVDKLKAIIEARHRG